MCDMGGLTASRSGGVHSENPAVVAQCSNRIGKVAPLPSSFVGPRLPVAPKIYDVGVVAIRRHRKMDIGLTTNMHAITSVSAFYGTRQVERGPRVAPVARTEKACQLTLTTREWRKARYFHPLPVDRDSDIDAIARTQSYFDIVAATAIGGNIATKPGKNLIDGGIAHL